MKPLDPRLLKYAHAARVFIIEIAVLGVVVAALVIIQAFLIARGVNAVVSENSDLRGILPTIGWLAAVVLLRGVMVFYRESRAHRAADETVSQLRQAVIEKAVTLGPRWRTKNGANTVTLVTRGLDDLDPYFVRYLPQLLMVMTVTPATLVTILVLDHWSALVGLLTIPLIPIFMALIGRLTQSSSRQKLAAMERLGSQLLDVLTGLPTLRALGREKGPRAHLVRLSRENTRTTMQTLRIAFMSGGVLEFLATLSVALVAVQVGFRMVSGNLNLFTGLAIIMLAPEVYEPLRQVGSHFHASANGVAAANACFEILEEPGVPKGSQPAPPLTNAIVSFENLSVAARGAWAPSDLSGTILPGQITAVSGPSGAGKTTAAMVLLGLVEATKGEVTVKVGHEQPVSVAEIDSISWWENITWVPQSPTITVGSVLDNLPTGVSAEELEQAAKETGFDAVVDGLTHGWQTQLRMGGVGLSVGQRQRLALTRALISPPQMLILDEPTAHLDAVSEDQIVQILDQLRSKGTTILVIAHRAAVLDVADQVIDVRSTPATPAEVEQYAHFSSESAAAGERSSLPGFLDPSELKAEAGDD